MNSLLRQAESKLSWTRSDGNVCALDEHHEVYVTPTPFGVFRYVVWSHRAPRQLVAWGEAPTVEDAMSAAEHFKM